VHATNAVDRAMKQTHTTNVPRFASSVMSQSFQTKKGGIRNGWRRVA